MAPSCQRSSKLGACVRPTELISMKVISVNSAGTLYLLSMKISCLMSVLALQHYITGTWHLPRCLKEEFLWNTGMIPELKIKLPDMDLDYPIHCLPQRRKQSRLISPQDHISATCACVKPIPRFGVGRGFLCSLGRAGKDCHGFGAGCGHPNHQAEPWATFSLIHLNNINLCGMANLLTGFGCLTSDCIRACKANRQTTVWPGFSTQVGLCIPLLLLPRHPKSLLLPAEIKL